MEVSTIATIEREGVPESAFNHLWLQGDVLYASDTHDHIILSNHTGDVSYHSLFAGHVQSAHISTSHALSRKTFHQL